jgi:hypothetical protein
MKHPRPEQIKLRSTIHLPLDQFQSIDLSFVGRCSIRSAERSSQLHSLRSTHGRNLQTAPHGKAQPLIGTGRLVLSLSFSNTLRVTISDSRVYGSRRRSPVCSNAERDERLGGRGRLTRAPVGPMSWASARVKEAAADASPLSEPLCQPESCRPGWLQRPRCLPCQTPRRY